MRWWSQRHRAPGFGEMIGAPRFSNEAMGNTKECYQLPPICRANARRTTACCAVAHQAFARHDANRSNCDAIRSDAASRDTLRDAALSAATPPHC